MLPRSTQKYRKTGPRKRTRTLVPRWLEPGLDPGFVHMPVQSQLQVPGSNLRRGRCISDLKTAVTGCSQSSTLWYMFHQTLTVSGTTKDLLVTSMDSQNTSGQHAQGGRAHRFTAEEHRVLTVSPLSCRRCAGAAKRGSGVGRISSTWTHEHRVLSSHWQVQCLGVARCPYAGK